MRLERRRRSTMLVTGVIASAASSGKRSVQKRWSARGRNGSTASPPLGVAQQRRDLEDRRRQLGVEPAGDCRERGGGLGGQVDRAGRALAPFERRGEGVDHRLDPTLALGGTPAELKEVPAGQLGGAAGAEVDPHDPLGIDVREVGLDPLEGVAVGIEEEAAVTGPDEVGELRDRRLGLAVARAAGRCRRRRCRRSGRRRSARPPRC